MWNTQKYLIVYNELESLKFNFHKHWIKSEKLKFDNKVKELNTKINSIIKNWKDE